VSVGKLFVPSLTGTTRLCDSNGAAVIALQYIIAATIRRRLKKTSSGRCRRWISWCKGTWFNRLSIASVSKFFGRDAVQLSYGVCNTVALNFGTHNLICCCNIHVVFIHCVCAKSCAVQVVNQQASISRLHQQLTTIPTIHSRIGFVDKSVGTVHGWENVVG